MRTIWSPMRDLLQLHARLRRTLGDPAARRWGRSSRRAPAMPPLDFGETSDSFIVRVDLPGLKKEAVAIKVTDGSLAISADVRPPLGEGEEARLRRSERFRGSFRRVVPLPRQADSEKIEASLARGVLTVKIAKRVSDGGRRIEIS